MKILYLINNGPLNSGHGGHYHSLKATVEAVSKKAECIVVNIGTQESSVINSIDTTVYNIITSSYNVPKIFYDLIKIVKFESPDVIHAFDMSSHFYAKLISIYYKKPYTVTLCGGPNPTWFPKVKNLILFSNENMNFFKGIPKFHDTNIYYIPNRVWRPLQDYTLIEEVKNKLDPEAHIFIRISRMIPFYKRSILQSIALVDALNKKNIRSQLVIIGIAQDSDVYKEINKKTNENIFILTDKKYTENASKMIDISELVIGTGRGFMEGASLGKLMLCPTNHSEYPLLATNDNLSNLFENNFSMRSFDNSSAYSNNFDMIMQVLQNKERKSNLLCDIKRTSTNFFEIEPVIDKYIRIYQELESEPKVRIVEILIHFGIMTYANCPTLLTIVSNFKK